MGGGLGVVDGRGPRNEAGVRAMSWLFVVTRRAGKAAPSHPKPPASLARSLINAHPNPSQPHPRARKLERCKDPTLSLPHQLPSSPKATRAKPNTRLEQKRKGPTYRLKSLCPLVPASLPALPLAAVAGLAAGDIGVIRGVLLGHRETFSLPSIGGWGKKNKVTASEGP